MSISNNHSLLFISLFIYTTLFCICFVYNNNTTAAGLTTLFFFGPQKVFVIFELWVLVSSFQHFWVYFVEIVTAFFLYI